MNNPIVDLSKNNIVSSYEKASANIMYAILRIGYRGYTAGTIKADDLFEKHAKGFTQQGKKLGAYFMSQAITVQEARQEAEYCYQMFKKYYCGIPIFYDSEKSNVNNNGRADGLSKKERTDICIAFCDRLLELGMLAGVYASESWYVTNLDMDRLRNEGYVIWVAKYGQNTGTKGSSPTTKPCHMHQYTSRGRVAGISDYVDLSESYIAFEIKQETEQNQIYTQDDFIKEVCDILQVDTAQKAFARTVSISTRNNSTHALVTPLERYFTALGYYTGAIEEDEGKKPKYGKGMAAAVQAYQKNVVQAIPKYQDGIITAKAATWKKLLNV